MYLSKMAVSEILNNKMFVKKLIAAMFICGTYSYAKDLPKFVSSGTNVTAVVGRDATLACKVENLQNYKVAWLRVDTQTILTIGPHIITKNHRVTLTRGDPQAWAMTLKDVRPSDGGRYMCQINTEPMITQTHRLQVVVPPDIVDTGSSSEVMVHESENVSLHCAASGTPQPNITWRREDSAPFNVGSDSVQKWSGLWLNMTGVSRKMNAAFLCIATNGVPPSVSKRIKLHVFCKPRARAVQKTIGSYIGLSVVLMCSIEANPMPVIYWTHIDLNKLLNNSKYQINITSDSYKHNATLRVFNVTRSDIGSYQCHAENLLGTAHDDITLYTLVTTTFDISTTQLTTIEEKTTTAQPYVEINQPGEDRNYSVENDFVVVLSQHQMQSFDLSPSS